MVLLLAFVERPSSLSLSSDPRRRSTHLNPPCGATESVELVCLVVFALDLAVKVNGVLSGSPGSLTLTLTLVQTDALIRPPELPDWLGRVPKEQVADRLPGGDLRLRHRLDVVCQHDV